MNEDHALRDGSLALSAAATRVAALRAEGKTVVFTNGGFDVLHVGHVRMLEAAAAVGDVLLVGLNDDAHIRKTRGRGRPIVPAAERAELVAALGCVDHVFVFHDATVDSVLETLRPDVHAKGRDYDLATLPERATNERLGIRMVFVGDDKNHASTDLVQRAAAADLTRDRVVSLEDPYARGFILRAMHRALRATGWLDIETLATGKLGTFVEGPEHRFVRRVQCDGMAAYLKVTRPLSRGRSPIVEFQNHLALRAAGLRAPEPWLCIEGEVEGTKTGALMTREAPGTALHITARSESHETRRRLIADDVGAAVRALHTARFLHPDLQAWHLHVTAPGGGARSVWFLDLMRVTRAGKRVPRTPATRGLAALTLSLESHSTVRERLRGLRAYMGGTLRAARPWMRAIEKQMVKLRTKSTFRQDGASA